MGKRLLRFDDLAFERRRCLVFFFVVVAAIQVCRRELLIFVAQMLLAGVGSIENLSRPRPPALLQCDGVLKLGGLRLELLRPEGRG